MRYILFLLFLVAGVSANAQRGKDGAYTASATNEVLNAYTYLTANAAAGATSISLNDNALNSGVFSSNLAGGDLLFIIQAQGASLFGSAIPIGGGDYFGGPFGTDLGQVDNYNNCGNYEYVEVESVGGGGTVNLRCGLAKNYTDTGHVIVVRVPRFTDLTIPAGTSITATPWNGTTGGIVVLEVEGAMTVDGEIDADADGFRGGVPEGDTFFGTGQYFASNPGEGAEKGESIAGYQGDYLWYGGRYGKGSPANGGGGGNGHNGGGGGGANATSGSLVAWTGFGDPDESVPGWVSAWNLESTGFAVTSSPGGGRGGYTFSDQNENATTTGPGNTAWSGDNRRNQGGLGGRPLDYSLGRLFFGGGGGSADGENTNNDTGGGGRAGGMVVIRNFGTISGAGSIHANGEDGENSEVIGTPGFFEVFGKDGAGGGGAGGTIFIQSPASFAGPSLETIGGDGGDQVLVAGAFTSVNQAQGPGGGGGGGYIATTGTTATTNTDGGTHGTTNSPHLTEFPPNGATQGTVGLVASATDYEITAADESICSGQSVTLTASTSGTLPSGGVITWYDSQFGGSVVGTGATYTTPSLTTTTTYYVGICPDGYTIPVTVTVGGGVTIDDSNISIMDESCSNGAGEISGLVVSGGSGTYTYSWDNGGGSNLDATGLSAGNYTISVDDGGGCTGTAGPYTVSNVSNLVIDISAINIQDETCGNGVGSVTGITVSGGSGTYTYSWDNGGGSALDATGLSANSYTLTVDDGAGCVETSGPHVVNDIDDLVLDATGLIITDEQCGNADGEISGLLVSGGTGSYTYTWDNGAGSNIDASNLTANSYTLTVTDGTCSETGGPYVVSNNGGPTIDISGISIVDETCTNANGEIIGISVSGGSGTYSYSWNSGALTTLDITGLPAGSYTLEVDDGVCIATEGPFTITDAPGPVIDDAAMVVAPENCGATDGSITGLAVSGGTAPLTFTWNGNASAGPDLTNVGGGNYTLLVSDGNGCADSYGPVNVPSNGGPSIDESNVVVTGESCTGNDGSITGFIITGGTGTYAYTWNGSPSATSDLTGAASGSYTLTVDDGNCAVTSSSFTIDPPDPIIINNSGLTIVDENCGNEDGSISGITFTGGTAPFTYTWNGLNGTGTDTTGVGAGSYTLVITDGVGCTATEGPINVGGTPPVNINLTAPASACIGNSVNVSASGATSYTWSFGGTNASETIVINSDTTIEVFGVAGPCIDSAEVTITVDSLPTLVLSGIDTVCVGESTSLLATTNGTISWSTSESTAGINVSPLTDTWYIATATNACGTTTDSIEVHVIAPPLIDAGADVSIFAGGTASLSATGGTSYSWSPSTGLSCMNCQSPMASPAQSTDYIVTGSNGYCSSTDTVRVIIEGDNVVYVPTAFSPNNDGNNDVLFVRGNSIETLDFRVYDRWGQLVFSSSDQSEGWDGTKNGEPLSKAVFVFTVEGTFLDGTTFKEDGNISLLR